MTAECRFHNGSTTTTPVFIKAIVLCHALLVPSSLGFTASSRPSLQRDFLTISSLHHDISHSIFPSMVKHTLPSDLTLFQSPSDEHSEVESAKTRSYNSMGLLSSFGAKLDELSGDWALSYADLSPATPQTPVGISFLATNVGYALVGLSLAQRGDLVFGTLTEIAGIVSFWYHYSQLEYGIEREEVRLALLTDYFTALTAIITGGIYIGQIGLANLPTDIFVSAGISLVCLALCWVWEFGYPYIFLHSLWHLGSAYTGYLVGNAHLDSLTN